MTKIAITGPESSGKTTLTEALAEYYQMPFRPDESRLFFEDRHPQYEYDDLEKIAKRQWENEQLLISQNPKMFFTDTEMTSLKIWSKYRFGKVCDFIIDKQAEQNYDLILLSYPDTLWEPDVLRDNEYTREELFKLYLKEFELIECHFKIVHGIGARRLELAKGLIERISTEDFTND